ncbi:para-nitrobenzyl esterase [Colletotrichum asianum]
MSPLESEQAVTVQIQTTTVPSYAQTIIGKRSPISIGIEEFRGIPYAHVPGRWEHSRLRDCLPHDTFDATENGPRCPTSNALNSRSFQSYLPYPNDRQDEFECLNLLIMRPSKEALARCDENVEVTKLPVLIWIHGGGYISGAATSPEFDPARLILRSLSKKTPFIAVAINYRLGIFGFGASSDMIASQDSDAAPKGVNFGLHDQRLALIWVNRNIAAFGGNEAKVTIMGQSAGAGSCHTHLLEAELGVSKPLFRKAGLISGAWGSLDSISLKMADKRWAELCRLRSVEDESPVDRLEALKKVPLTDLLQSVSDLHWWFFAMVVDDLTIRRSSLGCHISVHLGHGEANGPAKAANEKVQIMVTASAREFEGFARMANWKYAKFRAVFSSSYPSDAAAENVLRAYGILPTSSHKELFDGFVQFISDATMAYKIHRAAEFFKTYRKKQAVLRGQDPRRVGVQTYNIEFGNPFPGPLQGVAHHGVCMIYTFGNFHDALEKVDQGTPEGYVEPGQEFSETTRPESPQRAEVADQIMTEVTDHIKSNIDLSYDMQDMYIQFIVEDNQETDKRTDPDQITTYCQDRSVCIESWVGSEKWRLRRERYDALEEDLDSMLVATRRLVGSVLDMPLE